MKYFTCAQLSYWMVCISFCSFWFCSDQGKNLSPPSHTHTHTHARTHTHTRIHTHTHTKSFLPPPMQSSSPIWFHNELNYCFHFRWHLLKIHYIVHYQNCLLTQLVSRYSTHHYTLNMPSMLPYSVQSPHYVGASVTYYWSSWCTIESLPVLSWCLLQCTVVSIPIMAHHYDGD